MAKSVKSGDPSVRITAEIAARAGLCRVLSGPVSNCIRVFEDVALSEVFFVRYHEIYSEDPAFHVCFVKLSGVSLCALSLAD